MTRTARLRLSHQSVVPQVCPHLVNVAVSLWKLPAETFTRDRQEPDHRRSDALNGLSGGGAGAPAGKGRGERGETRRGPNITPRGRLRQGAIHRLSNGCGAARSGVVCRGDIHTRGRLSAAGTRDGPDDLTWSFARAYRSSVTRCRRVPHVHAIPRSAWVGGAGRNHRPCSGVSISSARRHRATWPECRRDPSLTHRRRSSDQAYVPAEQPPPSQDARVPAAHAHARGPLDPVRASPQGPQESRRLSYGSTGPVPSRPCSQRSIASLVAMTCAWSRARGVGAGAARSWCTCSPRRAVSPTGSRAWASSSAVPSGTPSSATVSNVVSATCAVPDSSTSLPGVPWSCALSRPQPGRRTRNSGQISTVVSSGPSVTTPRSPGR